MRIKRGHHAWAQGKRREACVCWCLPWEFAWQCSCAQSWCRRLSYSQLPFANHCRKRLGVLFWRICGASTDGQSIICCANPSHVATMLLVLCHCAVVWSACVRPPLPNYRALHPCPWEQPPNRLPFPARRKRSRTARGRIVVPPRWHGDDSPGASGDYADDYGGEGPSDDGYGSSADEASQAQAAWHGAQPCPPLAGWVNALWMTAVSGAVSTGACMAGMAGWWSQEALGHTGSAPWRVLRMRVALQLDRVLVDIVQAERIG